MTLTTSVRRRNEWSNRRRCRPLVWYGLRSWWTDPWMPTCRVLPGGYGV